MSNLYAVILAGGAGTRFWPASRTHRPKQFWSLAGGTNEALLAATVRRILPICPGERVFVATGRHLVEASRQVVPALPAENFLAEPLARNTAPCIGWAAATIRRRDPEAVLMVLPSDHYVRDEEAFRRVLLRAVSAAEAGFIATIGLQPTRPETGYGYIERGERIEDGIFEVVRFIEKPNRERAEQFVATGRHYWNGGMFFFKASRMLEAIDQHLPELGEELRSLDEEARRGNEEAVLEASFARMPSISIDHGVMEKVDRIAVVPGDFGWSDVGSWHSAWELFPKDAHGNVASPDDVLVDAENNLVANLCSNGAKPIVALVGVRDLVVVRTDDALLILPRDRAQDVRQVTDLLKTRGRTDLL